MHYLFFSFGKLQYLKAGFPLSSSRKQFLICFSLNYKGISFRLTFFILLSCPYFQKNMKWPTQAVSDYISREVMIRT